MHFFKRQICVLFASFGGRTWIVRSSCFHCKKAVLTSIDLNFHFLEAINARDVLSPSREQVGLSVLKCLSSSNPRAHNRAFTVVLPSTTLSEMTHRTDMQDWSLPHKQIVFSIRRVLFVWHLFPLVWSVIRRSFHMFIIII